MIRDKDEGGMGGAREKNYNWSKDTFGGDWYVHCLIVMVVLWLHMYVKNYQTMQFNYVQYIVLLLYLNWVLIKNIHGESSQQECSFPPLPICLTSVLAFQLSFSSHINHWFILKYGWSPNSSKNALSPTHTPKLCSQQNKYSVGMPYLSAALSHWGQSVCVYMLKVKSYIHKKYDQSYWPSLLK